MTIADEATPPLTAIQYVGGPDKCPNIEVVKGILELTGRDESLIEYVTDRPGHDRRYSLSSDKTQALGWQAQTGFAEGLKRTVNWYRQNEEWWSPIRSGDYLEYYRGSMAANSHSAILRTGYGASEHGTAGRSTNSPAHRRTDRSTGWNAAC